MTQQEQTAVKPAKPGLIAVIERFGGPEEKRTVEFIHAPTKREMAEKLSDPTVAQVLGLVRGKKLDFKESRKVTW